MKIVLKKFNFPENFIKWLNILYTDIESKILVNGTFTDTFKIKRSVRQGCSLSMFLYALGLEPLIFKIKVSNGAKIRNRYNQVPHLTQDTNGKVTNSQKTPQTRAKRSALSQQVTTKHI